MASSDTSSVGEPTQGGDRGQRCLEAIAFVAVWMGIGSYFELGADAYLLVGVPLTIAFQVLVRRKPVAGLWVRDERRFGLDWLGGLVAAVLVLVHVTVPTSTLIHRLSSLQGRAVVLWMLLVVAFASAVPAAFALRRFRRETWRSLLMCLVVGGGLSLGINVLAYRMRRHDGPLDPVSVAWHVLTWFLFYFTYSFLMEEVSFRGLLDAHVHHPGEGRGWLSALFVSALWGTWHYPVVGHGHPAALIPLVAVSCVVGVPLSLYWRQSGNLAVPAATHAFADAVRNALGAVPHG